jgi:23S rRNA-/tRNA-specific pseudouridylate synthase
VADEFYSPAAVLRPQDIAGTHSENGHPSANGTLPSSTDEVVLLSRQALHAHSLRFVHPITREVVTYEAPLAADMQRTLNLLRKTS